MWTYIRKYITFYIAIHNRPKSKKNLKFKNIKKSIYNYIYIHIYIYIYITTGEFHTDIQNSARQ